MRLLFWLQLLVAKSAQDVTGVLPSDQLAAVQQSAVYVKFGAGTSAGAVVVEGAHDEAFTGTWANITTVNWAAANRVHLVAITGCHRAMRVRISVAIVGGTVDAYAMGN